MRHMFRIAAVAAAISAIAFGVLSGAADATRTLRHPSHISIKSKGLTFSGKVTSPAAPCKGSRHVTLYRFLGGHGNDQVLGSTSTNSAGKWKITAQGSAGISLGRFYAKVKRRSEGTAGTIHICKAARSRTIPLTP